MKKFMIVSEDPNGLNQSIVVGCPDKPTAIAKLKQCALDMRNKEFYIAEIVEHGRVIPADCVVEGYRPEPEVKPVNEG